MTDDARDAAIGRTISEYQDKKVRLAALRSELSRTSEALRFLALHLRDHPESLKFEADRISASGLPPLEISARQFEFVTLQEQVTDYAAMKTAVDHLENHIRQLGLPIVTR